MLNYTREDLVKKTALTNQMRNNLYHFLRYLYSKKYSDDEIKERLNRMGKNIATTILENKTFLSQSLEEIIPEIYSELFESKITMTQSHLQLSVEDKKCSLCKYKREDITLSPCIVISSLVKEICGHYGYNFPNSSVIQSVALGDISCIHSFTLKEREE